MDVLSGNPARVTGFLALGLVELTGCYEPDILDCTLRCASNSDCALDQVCGSDHLCAAPELAGTCAHHTDAGVDVPVIDARHLPPHDAASPDAASWLALHVHIDGKGRVLLNNASACEAAPPDHGDCDFTIPWGVPAKLVAEPYTDQRFERWTSVTCAAQGATCTFTPLVPTEVNAKFRKDG